MLLRPRKPKPYPKPQETGGILIRRLIAFLRAHKISPTQSKTGKLIIAISGGADSLALAHILVHYGRNICPRRRLRLLHINHNWRGDSSKADEVFVKTLAKEWGVPLTVKRLKWNPKAGESWEDLARTARKKIYAELSKKHSARIFTGHHMDDQAETVLWRLLTGANKLTGGILVEHGVEVRPLLTTRKKELENYLSEEGLTGRVDDTNFNERFLRARMRKHLMPVVEEMFPKSIEKLAQLGLSAQRLP
ncbi:tRNA lysidine(34) synthetase TilS [Bdellovibrionota bacterium FG-2]